MLNLVDVRRLALVLTAAATASCDKQTALGEANSVIIVAAPELWAELEQETYDALEPTVFTTRDENTFNVTHVAPDGNELPQLLLLKKVVVFGTPEDPRLGEIVDEMDEGSARVEPGAIIRASDVWARGQTAIGVVLDPATPAATWRAALEGVHELLDAEFRAYAVSRMFASGVDTALAAAVAERYGVALRAPRIYRGTIDDQGFIRLRNDRPSPADRIRSVLIERRERAVAGGGDAGAGDALVLDPEALFAWREGVDSVKYNVPQSIERVPLEPRRFELDGAEALEVRGIWHDEGTYPAAGPFLARAVRCPDATWYFDAWLYSPNAEDSKYEYLLQLEEILDSFRCTTNR